MTLMQTVTRWAKHTLNLEPPKVEPLCADPFAEVDERIQRGRQANEALVSELKHHEKADVASALLRARERATLP